MPEEIEPGWTAVKRMPCLAYSAASAWVIDWMPPLPAAQAAMYGWANIAEVEEKSTTAASSPRSSAGIASRMTRKVP